MSLPERIATDPKADRLTEAASALGYEIVDIAGFLDLVEEHAQAQNAGVRLLRDKTQEMQTANAGVRQAVDSMAQSTQQTKNEVDSSASLVRGTGEKSRSIAGWVQDVATRTQNINDTLHAVKNNNQQIATIANQVNTLAINAKIEAARAGDAGRGFAVVAEAINELSQQTKSAATQISENIEALTEWIATLGTEAGDVAEDAAQVLESASGTDSALGRIETSIALANEQAQEIAEHSARVQAAIAEFDPALAAIDASVHSTSEGIEQTHKRVLRLIDTSETIVQSTALLNGSSVDAPFIHQVQQVAKDISTALEEAIDSGRTTLQKVFDRNYRPIPGSNPEQVMTEATALLDTLLPPIQEPVLNFDRKVVFCAAVDVNGYLPTHNLKFSQPPSDDPVWNTANCRNRRIFDDRVGLKAGRNTESFLLQVYRRDMGGGAFKMMKDLSAPIHVKGRHWGGVRLAYSFE